MSHAFGFRRKTLRKSLSRLDVNIDDLAELAGINLKLRAQNLSVNDFCNLTIAYENLIS